MKANYRQKVRNGPISRRPVRGTFAARAGWMPRSRRPQAVWIFVFVGALVAGGFVAGLHWQLSALYTSREEVRLKSALSQAESEQKFLELEHGGVRTPREVARMANKRGGFLAVTLDEPSALRIPYQMAAGQARAREQERERERQRKENLIGETSKPGAPTMKENRPVAPPATVTAIPPQ